MKKTNNEYFDGAEESDKVQYAVDLAMRGHMCSGAIVMAYAKEFGLDMEMAAKISAGLAGGIAQGKTCGAVLGAVLVIGLKYGKGMMKDAYSRDLCFQITQEFSHQFLARRHSLECNEILMMNHIDPKNPKEMSNLREKGLCGKIVKDSAEILESLFLPH